MYCKIVFVFSVLIVAISSDTAPTAPEEVAAAAPQTPAAVPAGPAAPASPQNHGLNGVSVETKHPDGSITTVTNFKGNYPPGFTPNNNPFFPYGGFNPYFYNPYAYGPGPQPNQINPGLQGKGPGNPGSPIGGVPPTARNALPYPSQFYPGPQGAPGNPSAAVSPTAGNA